MSTAVATEFPTQMYIDGAWCDAPDGQDAGGDQSGRRVGRGRGGLRRAGRTRSGRSRRPRGRFPSGGRRRSTIAPRS